MCTCCIQSRNFCFVVDQAFDLLRMLIQTNRYRGYRLSVGVDSNWSPPSEAMSKRNRESQADAAAVVPTYINWSVEEVADWVESLGFPQYRVR